MSQPSKQTGQFHSMKGSVVEAVGKATGWDSWQRNGKEEHAAGEGEYNAARAKGYAEGTGDRVKGKKDSVFGGLTGDHEQEVSGHVRQDKGEAQQEDNKNA